MRSVRRVGAIAAVALVLGGCTGSGGSGGSAGSTTSKPGRTEAMTVRVPADQPTLTAAVKAAVPGDLILVSPGVYKESVLVTVPGITIRGLDRNRVVFDGEHTKGDGITVSADHVAVENLTVRNYKFNGIFFVPEVGEYTPEPKIAGGTTTTVPDEGVLEGYRVSFTTTYNNGLYGVYAFRARGGVIEDSYASGHPDSGFYVGQCDPCDAVVRRVVAEGNVAGFQGTNSSTNLAIVESTFRNNRIGIQPSSDTAENRGPQHDLAIIGNRITDNGNAQTPLSKADAFGYGITLGGTSRDRVERNLVTGNPNSGISLLTDVDGFVAKGNRISGNVLRDNGVDLEVVSPVGRSEGSCFLDNTFTTSEPPAIATALPCDATTEVTKRGSSQRVAVPPGIDHKSLPAPPDQPTMPDAATAPARRADGMPAIDLAAIVVPT